MSLDTRYAVRVYSPFSLSLLSLSVPIPDFIDFFNYDRSDRQGQKTGTKTGTRQGHSRYVLSLPVPINHFNDLELFSATVDCSAFLCHKPLHHLNGKTPMLTIYEVRNTATGWSRLVMAEDEDDALNIVCADYGLTLNDDLIVYEVTGDVE